jgi:hypothetical protein
MGTIGKIAILVSYAIQDRSPFPKVFIARNGTISRIEFYPDISPDQVQCFEKVMSSFKTEPIAYYEELVFWVYRNFDCNCPLNPWIDCCRVDSDCYDEWECTKMYTLSGQ